MSYASLELLVDRYGGQMLLDLTDRAVPAAGEIDQDVVARALSDTDAQIDGYLAGRYRLPMAQTPDLVVDLALQIAIYKLHRTSANEKIKDDYNAAVRALRDISAGVVRLNVEGAEPAASGGSEVRVNDRPRDMTPENLKGFV